MSNNQGQKEFGNAHAGLGSNLPEIKARDLEIKHFILTKEQTEYYLNVGRSIELMLWKNWNSDFKAKNEALKINIQK